MKDGIRARAKARGRDRDRDRDRGRGRARARARVEVAHHGFFVAVVNHPLTVPCVRVKASLADRLSKRLVVGNQW